MCPEGTWRRSLSLRPVKRDPDPSTRTHTSVEEGSPPSEVKDNLHPDCPSLTPKRGPGVIYDKRTYGEFQETGVGFRRSTTSWYLFPNTISSVR